MKIIIPIEYYRHGGVERVIVSLVKEFSKVTDQVILVLPSKEVSYFQIVFKDYENITVESFSIVNKSLVHYLIRLFEITVNSLRMSSLIPNKTKKIQQKIKDIKKNNNINYLIKKYNISHGLYMIANQLTPPKVPIPLAMIVHDVFWHFSPLTYSASYIETYDKSLLAWLKKANVIFTVSYKTRQDIISIFPDFSHKIKAIPNSGFIPDISSNVSSNQTSKTLNEDIIFYFPSSFGVYKDQLNLVKAGLIVSKSSPKIKIVLVGKETDGFLNGKLKLSQQSKSEEYKNYIQECQKIYKENEEVIKIHFQGLGYCSPEEVEFWYDNCNCVVVPSKYEGFGLALSEAIVRGIPVIASDLEVFREQVELYNCRDRVDFFAPGDPEALASCIQQFIDHPKPRLSASEIEVRFSHWTWEVVAQEYVKYLRSLQ
jgi:glycosyltransferase involved in cell wall biosynthesis